MIKLQVNPRISFYGNDNAILRPEGRMPELLVENEPFAPGFPVDLITDRQMQVFKLLGLGHSHRQIAHELNVNADTVRTHCARIRDRLKLSNTRKLLREAVLWHHRQSLRNSRLARE
jgi:DNA-binding NarL/FixJ family response regulator